MNINLILKKASTELKKAGIKTADLDVQVLLKYVLEKDDVYVLSHRDEMITNSQYQKFRRLIQRRKKGEPVTYLVGHKEFYGLDFFVNKNVLIPRPETEVLVEETLKYLRTKELKNNKPANQPISIIDIGTGSGCIIISIANSLKPRELGAPSGLIANGPSPRFYASDISKKALYVAKKNAKLHQVSDEIRFFYSNLFANKRLPKKFDLIIVNLPYLDEKSKGKKTRSDNIGLNFEPEQALYAGQKGFALIGKLVNELPAKLNSGGIALLEVNDSHSKELSTLCKKLNLKVSRLKNSSGWNGFYQIYL